MCFVSVVANDVNPSKRESFENNKISVLSETQTWYALRSGDWNDWETWTLDPSGNLPNNPINEVPSVEDIIVIHTGKTISIHQANGVLQCSRITIDGRLDISASDITHSFGQIRGGGRIILANNNFPDGDATHFNSSSGQGTVVYTGESYALNTVSSQSFTYYNMEVNLNDANQVLTLLGNCSLSNSLVISKGIFQINDDVSTSTLNITIENDLQISSGAKITVGQGNTIGSNSIGSNQLPSVGNYHNMHHRLTIGGNLHNEGELLLTNRTFPVYDELATDGAAVLEFNTLRDSKALLEGTSNLYTLIVNKGVDKTYQLEIDATDESYFALLGPNSLGRVTSAPYSESNPEVRKALWIQNGTLKLNGKIHIPSLSEGNSNGGNGDFQIGQNGRLWIASADTRVYTTAQSVNDVPGQTALGVNGGGGHQALSIYGELMVSDGFLSTRNSAGLIFWGDANGQMKISGGTIEAGQIRSQSGASGVVSYNQSGGEIIIWGNKNGAAIGTNFPLFGLDSESSVFQMSGGSINFKDANNSSVPEFKVLSAESNYQVTGGNVVVEMDDTDDFDYHSTVPVYNLTVKRQGEVITSMSHAFKLESNLVVLHDLVLETPDQVTNFSKDVVRFLHNGNDVTIGRNFTIERAATYEHHAMSGYNNRNNTQWLTSWSKNTTTFNGTEDGVLYYTWYDNPSHAQEQVLWNLTVDKQNGASIKVECDDNNRVVTDNTYARLVRSMGELRVENGTLDQGNWGIRAFGPIVNKGTLCTYEHGVTRHGAYLATNISNQDIQSSDDAIFGYVKLEGSTSTAMTFTSDIYIKRLDYKRGNINLGTHKLKLDYLVKYNTRNPYVPFNNIGDASSTKMIYTAGNASDGGLQLKVDANQSNYIFPIGCNGKYTPAMVEVKNSNISDGYITIVPVDQELQTTNLNGGSCLSYYWDVQPQGFEATKPIVQLTFRYNNNDIPGSIYNAYDYVAGEVLNTGAFTRWYEDSPSPDYSSVAENSKSIVLNGSSDNGFEIKNASYTAGREARFEGSPEVYYLNTGSGTNLWTNPTSWVMDRDASIAASDYPKEGDVAILQRQGAFYSGLVTVNQALNVGRVVFDDQHGYSGGCPRIIFSNNNNYHAYSSTLNYVEVADTHTGTELDNYAAVIAFEIDEHYNGDLPNGDFSNFHQYDDALIIYDWSGASSNAEITLSDSFTEYPSLWFSGGNNSRLINMPNEDVTINRNMNIVHHSIVRAGEGKLTIGKDLKIGHSSYNNGQFLLSSSNANVSEINVLQDIILRNTSNNNMASQIAIDNAGNQLLQHNLNVYGDFQLESANASVQLGNDTNHAHAVLNLLGEGDHKYSSQSSNVVFSRIIVDKGGSQNHSFTFENAFNLTGPTNGLAEEKAFILKSGSAIFNSAEINLPLNTGGADFRIPADAALVVNAGMLHFYGDDSGIYLDGRLQTGSIPGVIPAGTVLINGMMASFFGDAPGNGNNYIEYSASGNAELILDGGMLCVGSQIRRPENTEEGILKYTQNNESGLVVGEFAAPVNNRGVFEILNDGSSFTQNAGDLHIVRPQENATFPAFYFDPETVSIESGTSIQIGQSSDLNSRFFDLYINKEIENLSILGANNEARLVTVPLTVGNLDVGDLQNTVPIASTFNANGQTVTIKKDFTNYGVYESNGNETIFTSESQQIIGGTAETTFSTLSKQGANSLVLEQNCTVENQLNVTSGTLSDGGHTVTLQGNLQNTSEIIHLSGGDGILFKGNEQQLIDGNGGTLGKMYIDNGAFGVKLTTATDSITIKNELCLKAGVLDIGENLLVMSEDAIFTPIESYGTNNMIQTNASFTDSGIKKYFNNGYVGSTTYPIGSGGKYTPVVANISSISGGESALIVKAANEMHPSIQEDIENPDTEIVDRENALNYYWSLRSTGVTSFTGHVEMHFTSNDILISNQNGSTYSAADYIPARLIFNESDWNKFDWADFEESNDLMRFSYNGVSDSEISGDYTAGVQPNSQTRLGAIPNSVPTYESVVSGDWSSASTWQTVPAGGAVPVGGPIGAQVIINPEHTVTIAQKYRSSYRTTINGTISTGTTFGNRLGIVEGTGTLISESEIIPAGFYDTFLSEEGGTLEYSGTNDYDILNNLSDINNLKLSGTGERRFPNVSLKLKGNFTIQGDNTLLNCINEHNQDMIIKGNLSFVSGSVNWGSAVGNSNPMVEFSGGVKQYINGASSFTDANSFNCLRIDNSYGVDLETSCSINNILDLQSGIVSTSSTAKLTVLNNSVNAIVGGDVQSYINGPLYKVMQSSQNFRFPLGQSGKFAPIHINTSQNSSGLWVAEYYKYSPSDHSRNMDVEALEDPLKYISHQEFWRVLGPNAQAKAHMTFNWGAHSGVDMSIVTMGVWKSSPSGDQWQALTCNTPTGSNQTGTITTSTARPSFDWSNEGSYYTFASDVLLAYSWLGGTSNNWFTADNWSSNEVPSANSDVTINTGIVYNPSLNGNAQIRHLNIVSGNLTIKAGSQVTINGDLKGIDHGLIVENSNTGLSSLISKGSVEPLVTYRWQLPQLRYWYIGLPLSGVTMEDFEQSLTQNGNAYVLYNYKDAWNSIQGNMNYDFYESSDINTTALEGYSLNIKDASSTLEYDGKLNASDSYSRSFVKAGWYLVGNPYPSYLDITNGIDLGSFKESTWVRTNLGNNSRGFATYNIASGLGQNGGTKYIVPGQSFWVRTYTGNDDIVINSRAQLHSSVASQLKSASAEANDVIRLLLEQGDISDELVLAFREEGSFDVTKYDSEKRMGDDASANIFAQKASKLLSINVLPQPNDTIVIPVGYQLSNEPNSTLQLNISDINSVNTSWDILLKDNAKNHLINLRNQSAYHFEHMDNTNDRFELLVCKNQLSTTLPSEKLNQSEVNIYAKDEMVKININENSSLKSSEYKVSIYDLSGQSIHQGIFNTSYYQIPLKGNRVAIVKVQSDGMEITKKVVL